MEKYLTFDETAEALRISPRTLARIVASGKLLGARVGGRRLLFRVSDIERYAERSLRKAAR
jgi:excisionase family DNA binding protein